jgi:hypothetical protein
MSEELQKKQISLQRSLAFDLLDTDEKKEQTNLLLDEFLPHLAADIENLMHEQKATLFHEIFTDSHQPKIRVVLKLAKFEHEFIILLDSKNAMFVIGSERGGVQTNSALNATIALKPMLFKLKV